MHSIWMDDHQEFQLCEVGFPAQPSLGEIKVGRYMGESPKNGEQYPNCDIQAST